MMMSKDETLSYNRRCAAFLGWQECLTNEFDEHRYCQTVDGYMATFQNTSADPQVLAYNKSVFEHAVPAMRFHSDWNWVMEVVDAVSKRFGEAPLFREVYQKWLYETRSAADRDEIHDFLLFRLTKDETVRSVNQFLIWHNNNNNSIL